MELIIVVVLFIKMSPREQLKINVTKEISNSRYKGDKKKVMQPYSSSYMLEKPDSSVTQTRKAPLDPSRCKEHKKVWKGNNGKSLNRSRQAL